MTVLMVLAVSAVVAVSVVTATILTQMMEDEFNCLWPQIQNYIAEADADLIPVPGKFE